ncbi:UDP-N-acetylmuramate: L-alanyl-gamma-D-glutamyl-meso-diaminopimelate ligase [Chitinophaga terrae (ex Kim and Jung 2007)]|uniref:UDP-N-acetylmuramate--L-alanine ligase n=1 Tax=Chitinophaga terrae (ex Kim and Jung 2007) TaxID=408074 RepID=UPI002783BEB1|nr:Mur ligase family protein [Chitinophaga terrae (ex Kim and Jung 2007)]MDQ0109344.1 UDP-N-acetylmuramate: L-alanyl-gamma-D-glutamyl-meso-diaminopimelate ligase [Chitinophaga terrae (ex Kim and Jung 2007)]
MKRIGGYMTKVHFIAIGGSVMHQLAIALKNKGYLVTGSDDEIFEPALSNLRQAGILPAAMGWDAGKITADTDAIILGMHAREDNPELIKARELGLKIYSFPEYIYQESREKTRVAIGGSHGKTTTTAMIMHVLQQNKRDFDYLVGAKLEGFAQSVNITNAPIIVCEADEYPASVIEKRPKFHFLHPQIAVLTGIAWDHINVFPTYEIYETQFAIFIRDMQAGAVLIYNNSDPALVKVVEANGQHLQLIPYAIPEHHIENGVTTVTFGNHSASLKVFGDHNLLNMHAARLVCNQLGISDADFLSAISSFKGAAKRLELVAANDHCAIYRDFAHAPSKVKATMEATQQQFPGRKLIAVLELHTYSSLNADFLDQYYGALDPATIAAVYYSKHALEIKRMPDLSPELIAQRFGRNDLHIFNSREKLENFLQGQSYQDTNLLLMSSGTYDGLDFPKLAALLPLNNQHTTK